MNANPEKITVYNVESYKTANQKFIDTQYEEYELTELEQMLEINNGYNVRIHKKQNYIFFGDLDKYNHPFAEFISRLILFLKEKYDIAIEESDISHTQNDVKNDSYHYSIPKLYCSCEKLKTMHEHLREEHSDHFIVSDNGATSNCIDTTIYSEHWFRLPNQYKGKDDKSMHKIVKGLMVDFIVMHIPNYSVNIEDKQYANIIKTGKMIPAVPKQKKLTIAEKKTVEADKIEKDMAKKKNELCLQKYNLYRRLFDECFSSVRCDDYNDWISVGMALKNIYGDDAYRLFDYLSSKSTKYEGSEKTLEKFASFDYRTYNGKGIKTIYKFAKKDNKSQYNVIMNEEENSFTETDFAKKLFELAGDDFVYVKIADGLYSLYCFNGKYWVCDDLPIRQYITNKLLPYYRDYISNIFSESRDFKKIQRAIYSLATLKTKNSVIKLYKEFAVKKIEFDTKWWLFGFDNCVYDLQKQSFRNYEKTDYISIVTGYDWIEPTADDLKVVNSIIDQIMPIAEERDLYLSILSTSLEGRCLEKFIVENGHGRNGKGVIGDLLLKAMGKYGFIANNSILFETNKTGSNPEKANMHKKRLIIFREPPQKNKFENSIVKELTGGGGFSARTHHETETEKLLHCTIICECNKRPLFAEEPTTAEVERLIDIYFRSTFTDDASLLEQEYYYKGNKEYKTEDFQNKYKCSLLKILMNSHIKYSDNNCTFIIPEFIKARTQDYLEMSCFIYQWFKDNYYLTEDNNDILKISDIHSKFTYEESDNLSKLEKRKYNYKYFLEYFSSHMSTKRYYKERYSKQNHRNILLGWNPNNTYNSEKKDIDAQYVC